MADDLTNEGQDTGNAATLDAGSAPAESAGFETSAAPSGFEAEASAPPPPAPAPVTYTQPSGISAEDIARANYQTFGPLFQQLAPKPEAPKHPWNDPSAYWSMAGVPEDRAHAEFDRRLEQRASAVAESLVEKRLSAALDEQRKQFAQALAWQESQFKAQFAADPAFSKIESHYRRYVNEGVPPQHARRLAEMDAGISRGAPVQHAAPPAPAASAPMPPRHATSPATRTAAPAVSANKWKDFTSENERRSRFDALAAKFGVE